MKNTWVFFLNFILLLNVTVSIAQDSAQTNGKLSISGYLDTYYAFDFNQPADKNRLYAVSSANHNSFSINMAAVTLQYTSAKVRAKLMPAVGSYMSANYAAEPVGLRNLVEANAGVKIHEKKNIWLEAGIFSSPVTYETPISHDQLLYTRSFAPEFVPYYLMGAKLTAPITKKTTAYIYIVNGWQQIVDVNNTKSVIAQLEYKPKADFVVNGNLYYGSEKNFGNTRYRNRFLFDVFTTYYPKNKKLWWASSFYFGFQDEVVQPSIKRYNWWQANIAAKYAVAKKITLCSRIEYLSDKNGVLTSPINIENSFKSASLSLGANFAVSPLALLRIEARGFSAEKKVYFNNKTGPTENNALLVCALSVVLE